MYFVSRYIRDYLLITNLIFMALIPLVVLITVNSLLYRLLESRPLQTVVHVDNRAKRDKAIALMFIVIVVVFVVCHSLKLVVTFYEVCRVRLIVADKVVFISKRYIMAVLRTFLRHDFFMIHIKNL